MWKLTAVVEKPRRRIQNPVPCCFFTCFCLTSKLILFFCSHPESVRIELLPASDPRSVAPHSMVIISTVLVATASPQSNIVASSSDSNKLLPASDPWAVAANPVAFISTPPLVSTSSEGHPSTTAPNVELLPASDPWAVAQDPVTFVSTPFAASASPECHSQTIPECS